MTDTKIEWADKVWNPVTGCTKVSQGCKNCYAERIANRFYGKQEIFEGYTTVPEYINPDEPPLPVGEAVYRPRKFTDVICHEDRLDIPTHWRKPQRIFVNSMSDLFHPDVPDEFIGDVWLTMQRCEWHTFQILTKRPERMCNFLNWLTDGGPILPNVWLGVSVEDQKTAYERIPWLLETPAAVRFVSYEPALGKVDFGDFLCDTYSKGGLTLGRYLDWIIAGGESGPGARPAHPDWFRSVRDQCLATGVPFFFKQWGEWHYDSPYKSWRNPKVYMDRSGMIHKETSNEHYRNGRLCFDRVGKKVAGRLLDGREWNEYPEVIK